MVFPENIVEKLGFTEIKRLIALKCISAPARELVEKIQPQTKFDQIEKFLRQTKEFTDLIQRDAPLPLDHVYPMNAMIEKVRVEGTFLLEDDFYRIHLSLKTVFAIIRYFEERKGQYFYTEMLLENIPVHPEITRSIEQVLDESGKMKANASKLLLDLNHQIQKSESEARKTLDTVYRQAQKNGWTADGNLTIRDGRLCIPILAENKRKLKGFVHDESATGQTVYIEPQEVFHLNNVVRDLEFDKRREIIRILKELTDTIRPHLGALKMYNGLLTKIDFIRAKALFAIDLDATLPELTTAPEVKIDNARHPILYLNAKKDTHHPVVPLFLQIDQNNRIILVSGPNAGGKSVCMKTVGLLQLMVQSGILVPVDPTSRFGVFRKVFADIGDDQSIESDLSTYSAHLSKMKHFTKLADAHTLVLIDEFGTGTDPQFGGPIAEAVLEVLNNNKVKGVITTHYSNLKIFASNQKGLENASMLFDNERMLPKYILQVGKPGSSYALEIARKIGLPNQVLELAKSKIGENQKNVEYLLVNLEKEKREVYDTKNAIKKREKELEKQTEEYTRLKAYLDENQRELMRTAKQEARQIVKDANKLVENTIAEIKATKADKEKTKKLRSELETANQNYIERVQPAKAISKSQASTEELEVGDWVKLLDSNAEGQIIEVAKNKNIIVALGELRTVVKPNKLEKMTGKEKKKAVKKYSSSAVSDNADFSPEVDVRGMRTEDALHQLEIVLDRTVMIGYPSLKIIHGKGDGILRKFIRDYLRKYSHVGRIEDEHADRGGDGITYAYIQ